MTKTAKVSTDTKNAEMEELQRRIEDTAAMLYDAKSTINEQTRERESLKLRLEGLILDFKDSHNGVDLTAKTRDVRGSFDQSMLNADERRRYDEIFSGLSNGEKELIASKQRMNELQDQEASLFSSMATLSVNYAPECLLQLQKKQNEAERKVWTISEAISAQEKIIEQEKTANQKVVFETGQRREEMLAAVALGTVGENEQPAIDEQLSKDADTVSKSTENMNDAVSMAQQTINGLQRMLETAEKELAAMKLARSGAEKRFLLAEAEKAGSEYANAASVLTTNYRRLLAMQTILSSKNHPTIEDRNIFHCCIPTFKLDSHKNLGQEGEMSETEQAARLHYLEMDVQGEIERFAQAGIVIQ